MTCHLCAEAIGIARDGDRLLCLDCWRARHVVRPEDKHTIRPAKEAS